MASGKDKLEELHKAHQENAAFRFLPFAVDLFERRELRLKRVELLPIADPEAIPQEVMALLEQVITRGTLAFLCRAGGWQAISVADPGREEPKRRVRMIDRQVWEGLRLRFTDESVLALLLVYNAMGFISGQSIPSDEPKERRKRYYDKTRAMTLAANGDMLVHHIAYLNLEQAPFRVHEESWQFITNNPLTALARLDPTHDAGAVWDRVLAPDMQPLWPWLGEHLSQCWHRTLERSRWDSLEWFHRLNLGMQQHFSALFARAQAHDRRDWLLPVLCFFQRHFQAEADAREERWLREFNRLARDLRFADRDMYRRTWAAGLDHAWQLYNHYMDARSIHPVDRESPDRLLMEAYEACDFTPTAERARALVNQLNAVIT